MPASSLAIIPDVLCSIIAATAVTGKPPAKRLAKESWKAMPKAALPSPTNSVVEPSGGRLISTSTPTSLK